MATVAVSLRGAAAMFSVNAKEEWRHGQALVRWLVARGGLYVPRGIAAPSSVDAAPAWEEAYRAITAATALERQVESLDSMANSGVMRCLYVRNGPCVYVCLQVTESLLHVHLVASGCGDIATAEFISQKMLREQVH